MKARIPHIDGNKDHFDRLAVDPNIDNKRLIDEGIYHIRLYQAIREYAQDNAAVDKEYVTAISTYILLCLYALLGAFVHVCRSDAHKKQNDRAEHRYTMAFILGATVSVFSTLFSNQLPSSPYVLAFLAGYSTDALLSRLDSFVEKMKHSSRR